MGFMPFFYLLLGPEEVCNFCCVGEYHAIVFASTKSCKENVKSSGSVDSLEVDRSSVTTNTRVLDNFKLRQEVLKDFGLIFKSGF
jgi:hypothetical protein